MLEEMHLFCCLKINIDDTRVDVDKRGKNEDENDVL